jgi:uncharacterized membrane protein YhaH (DUF805 family)
MYTLTVDTIYNRGDFKGIMARGDFWKWVLFSRIWLIILAGVMGVIAFLTSSPGAFNGMFPAILLMICAEPAAATRRLHDVGKSGWFMLVPIYGVYLLFKKAISANETNFE